MSLWQFLKTRWTFRRFPSSVRPKLSRRQQHRTRLEIEPLEGFILPNGLGAILESVRPDAAEPVETQSVPSNSNENVHATEGGGRIP